MTPLQPCRQQKSSFLIMCLRPGFFRQHLEVQRGSSCHPCASLVSGHCQCFSRKDSDSWICESSWKNTQALLLPYPSSAAALMKNFNIFSPASIIPAKPVRFSHTQCNSCQSSFVYTRTNSLSFSTVKKHVLCAKKLRGSTTTLNEEEAIVSTFVICNK